MVSENTKADLLQSAATYARKVADEHAATERAAAEHKSNVARVKEALQNVVLPALNEIASALAEPNGKYVARVTARRAKGQTAAEQPIGVSFTLEKLDGKKLSSAPSCDFDLDDNAGAMVVTRSFGNHPRETEKLAPNAITDESVWKAVRALFGDMASSAF